MNISDYIQSVRDALNDYHQSTKVIFVSLYKANKVLWEKVRELEEKLKQYETN